MWLQRCLLSDRANYAVFFPADALIQVFGKFICDGSENSVGQRPEGFRLPAIDVSLESLLTRKEQTEDVGNETGSNNKTGSWSAFSHVQKQVIVTCLALTFLFISFPAVMLMTACPCSPFLSPSCYTHSLSADTAT